MLRVVPGVVVLVAHVAEEVGWEERERYIYRQEIRTGKDNDGSGFWRADPVYGGLIVEMVMGEGDVNVVF